MADLWVVMGKLKGLNREQAHSSVSRAHIVSSGRVGSGTSNLEERLGAVFVT